MSGCCDALASRVNAIVAAWQGGRDLEVAVKQVISVHQLTQSQVSTLCNNVNSALLNIGAGGAGTDGAGTDGGVSVDAASMPYFTPTTSSLTSGFEGCDEGLGTELAKISKLTDLTAAFCQITGFAAALMTSKVARHTELTTVITEIGLAYESVKTQVIQDAERYSADFEVFFDALDSWWDAARAGVEAGVEELGEVDWMEAAVTVLKATATRYAVMLVEAAIQKNTDTLSEELVSRNEKYSLLEQKISLASQKLLDISVEDWWGDFESGVERAIEELDSASAGLVNEDGSPLNNWKSLGKIDDLVAATMRAKNHISMGLTPEEELKLTSKINSAQSSDPFGGGRMIETKGSKFFKELAELGEAFEEMQKILDCIEIQNNSIKAQSLIIIGGYGIFQVMAQFGVAASLTVTIDIEPTEASYSKKEPSNYSGSQTSSTSVADALQKIANEMRNVLVRKDKSHAPSYIKKWTRQLNDAAWSTTLTTGSGINSYLNPNSVNQAISSVVSGYSDVSADASSDAGAAALATLEGIVEVLQENVSNWNTSIDKVRRFVAADGYVLKLLANRVKWEEEIGTLRSELNSDITRGNNTISQCDKYFDYDNEHYDFVVDTLKDWGLKGAALAIEKCQIPTFLNMPLNVMASLSAAAKCLMELLNSETLTQDLGISMAMELEQAENEAISIATLKAPPMLPALQFEAINLFVDKALGIKAEIESLVGMQKHEISILQEGINAAAEAIE